MGFKMNIYDPKQIQKVMALHGELVTSLKKMIDVFEKKSSSTDKVIAIAIAKEVINQAENND